jgi:S-adenosylmethionine-diacylglycerol 3-amino-3-carboxypropyl transferase
MHDAITAEPATVTGSIGTRAARKQLNRAVRQADGWSADAVAESLFARLFTGLVYAQIWEDPAVDMEALQIAPGNRVITIASGSCNALSYLVADPARVEAVDLNPAHVALGRLKQAAISGLPDAETLFRFLGAADRPGNTKLYDRSIALLLDEPSRRYWESSSLFRRPTISVFERGLYRRGLLGRFIGFGHRLARFYGVDPAEMMKAGSLAEQRAFFEERLAPLFDKPLIRWITNRKWSLFGLGIPPKQHEALVGESAGMAAVLRERLEKLACDFPIADNYFAAQAFGRRYDKEGPLPPYLMPANHTLMRERVDRYSIACASLTDVLAVKPHASVDRFVLLDAQDWMSDAQIDELWREITRSAAPGARVIFRTAGAASVLPGRIVDSTLARWRYEEVASRDLHARDRSSIYGGFHLYVLEDQTR